MRCPEVVQPPNVWLEAVMRTHPVLHCAGLAIWDGILAG